MTEFDPEKFEDKYEHYFMELQQAYQRAFDEMSVAHESDLIHAIDQTILAESEPFYEGDGQFRVELPDEPVARLDGVVATDGVDVEAVLERYVDEIEAQLRSEFGFASA